MEPMDLRKHAVFLDFDGTLVEFAGKPGAVTVSAELRALLRQLLQHAGGATAIITGRAVASLDALLGMPQLPVAGGHGLEWRLAEGAAQQLDLDPGDLTIAVERLMGYALRRNLIFENKPLGFALHFRLQPELQSEIDAFIAENIAGLHGLRIIVGKYVREVQPVGVDKGMAVARFMELPPFARRIPCYFGDDTTDEDAFRWTNAQRGLTFKVGGGPTCAHHRMEHVAATIDYLRRSLKSQ